MSEDFFIGEEQKMPENELKKLKNVRVPFRKCQKILVTFSAGHDELDIFGAIFCHFYAWFNF